MTDIHVYQLIGRTCPGRNCAAASGAMAVAAATDGGTVLSADRFRVDSKISCTPGVHTRSGGLPIYAVVAVALGHGVSIEFGNPPKPWPMAELEKRLRAGWGAVVLGDYEAAPDHAPTTFAGDHSVWVHGFRVEGGVKQTHWHDPLRTPGYGGRWVSLAAVIRYWRFTAGGGRVAGYAGFVRLPPPTKRPARNVDGWALVATGSTYYRARGTWDHNYPVKLTGPQKITTGGRRWVGASHVGILPGGTKITVRRIAAHAGGDWITAWIPVAGGPHVTPV